MHIKGNIAPTRCLARLRFRAVFDGIQPSGILAIRFILFLLLNHNGPNGGGSICDDISKKRTIQSVRGAHLNNNATSSGCRLDVRGRKDNRGTANLPSGQDPLRTAVCTGRRAVDPYRFSDPFVSARGQRLPNKNCTRRLHTAQYKYHEQWQAHSELHQRSSGALYFAVLSLALLKQHRTI